MNKTNKTLVLGLFETGLGVIRSLGREGIKVYGFDYKKDIACYSKYVKADFCPHPLKKESEFVQFLLDFGKKHTEKIVLFITSDEFLISVSRNRKQLEKYYLINLSEEWLISSISNKYEQYALAKKAGIKLPRTLELKREGEIESVSREVTYPVFIKALDVNLWRKKVSPNVKGFEVTSGEEFVSKAKQIISKDVDCVVQEIIKGPDTNHYKFSAYFNREGKMLHGFTLQKIRQYPVRFGVGAIVESVENEELFKLGETLFENLNYKGVGSAEFKIDNKDGEFKLIEINARYWQQNYLPTACGMNFPLTNYLDLTNQAPEPYFRFKPSVKWVNIYMDFSSFLEYRRLKEISFRKWIMSLRGKKIFSDWSWRDPIPGFYEIKFGLTILKLPFSIIKRLFKK